MQVWWRVVILVGFAGCGVAVAVALVTGSPAGFVPADFPAGSWRWKGFFQHQHTCSATASAPGGGVQQSVNRRPDSLAGPGTLSDMPQSSPRAVSETLPATVPRPAGTHSARTEEVKRTLRGWLVASAPTTEATAQKTDLTTEAASALNALLRLLPSGRNEAADGQNSPPSNEMLQHGNGPAATEGAGQLPPPSVQAAGDRLTIRARQADIREVLEMLSRETGLSIIATPTTTGTVSATLHGVDPKTALDSLVRHLGLTWWQEGNIIFVGQAQEIAQIRQSREAIITRVYRPNYVTAAELQKLVTPLLTQGVGQTTVTVSRVAVSSPTKSGIAASSDNSGGDDFAGQEVLLVRDYASVIEIIDELLREVDQRPRQVALEAMILSVRLNDENQRGIDFELLRDENNARLISGTPLTDLAAINVTDGGLKFAFLDSSISAFVKALETVGDTDVIAAPRLMCLNKQRAEILIGSQLGYVSTTVTQTAATQTVQFLEVGTQLRFRPYIASDGMVRLEVHPELSTGSVRIEQGLTIPDKDVTQVTTNIMCRDGRTVIIGGLIREDLATNVTQIPVLGDIPVVGVLFRKKTDKVERREIIVLITPRIVRETQEEYQAARVRNSFLARQENYFDKMSPAAKRQYGLRYLRLARAAWNAGDAELALKYVNWSIHFDPQNLEATTLHQEILAALPSEYDTIDRQLNYGLAPWQIPTGDYSRSGAPWRGVAPEAFPEVEEVIETPPPTQWRDLPQQPSP